MGNPNQEHQGDDDRPLLDNITSQASPDEVEAIEKALKPEQGGDQGQADQGNQGNQGGNQAGTEDDDRTTRVDAELDAAGSDEERERIREERRLGRKTKRDRQKARFSSLQRRLENSEAEKRALAERIAALEQSNIATQYAGLNRDEDNLNGVINQLETAKAEATVKGDADTVREAEKRLNEARGYLRNVQQAKQLIEQNARRPKQVLLSPEAVSRAKAFQTKHAWYQGPKSKEPDSRVLTALDSALLEEGWDPSSEGYWNELEDRMGKYLAHRLTGGNSSPGASAGSESGYNGRQPGGQQQRKPVRSPVAGSGNSGTSAAPGRKTYRLSEARVQAMKEAGIWDDKPRRDAMIERYRKADEAQRNT